MSTNIVSKIPIKSCEPNKKFTIINNPDSPNGKTIVLISDYFSNAASFETRKTPWGAEIELYGITEAGFTILNNLVKEKNIKSLIIYSLVPYSTIDCSSGVRQERYKESFSILNKILDKLKTVDGIIFSGYFSLDEEYNPKFDANKFGRVFSYHKIPCIHTLSINRIAADKKGDSQEDLASLLGFFIYHLDIILEGKDRYTIRTDNWTSILVKTIDQFDEMMEDIKSSPVTCYDTETTGLSRTQETLLTVQIATSPTKAYILPWQHKQSPWNSTQLEYMRKKLKDYFERGTSKFHIYQNAKYDITQFFTHFKLKYYNHKIHDLMAGEFALDENRKFLTTYGIMGPYTLEFLAKNYGAGDIFKQGKLGKKDRTILADEDLEDIAEYGAKDVLLPYQIAKFQIQEAKHRGDKKFLKIVQGQISDMIYDFTIMEFNGSKIDKEYLLELRDNNSSIGKKFIEIENKFKELDSVKKANDLLLQEKGFSTKTSIFGIKKWLFNINTEDSQQKLFYDVLNLKPLEVKKNGKGALGKDFKEHYKDVPEVALLNEHDKIKKVKTTFIDAHFDRFSTDKDLAADSRLRSSYQFTGVVTGRASSQNPNLQQIPSRGEYSAMVRRQFVAPSNHLLMHLDYSAHEVRNWGNVAKDKFVGNAFDAGKQLRKQVRYYFSTDLEIWDRFRKFQKDTKWICKNKDEQLNYEQKVKLIEGIEDKKFKKLCSLCLDLENKGDVHKLNYEFFFGVPAYLVNKQQRQSVKSVVFGVIYGKGAKTLAGDINGTEEEAQHIMNMLFEKFKNGGDWIKKTQELGRTKYEVVSPLGRVRHLSAYRHPAPGIQSSMDRKGPNSCIQGLASDIGFMSGKILQDICWNWFWKKGIDFDFVYQNVVHDSTEDQCRIRHIPIAMYMAEHAYTTLVHRKLRDVYGFELICGYETEADVGGSLSNMETIENFCELERYVKEAIEWSKENIPNWTIEDGEWEAFLHNLKIIDNIRRKELKMTAGNKVDYEMLIDENNVLDLGLIL